MDDLKKRLLPWLFQEHVHRYWPGYVKAANDHESYDSDLVALLKKFLSSPMKSSEQYRRWVFWIHLGCVVNDSMFSLDVETAYLQPPSVALLAMVVYGFTSILQEWWDSADMNVSRRYSNGFSLLLFANSVEVMKLLLKRGINVNMPVNVYGSALGFAIVAGDLEKVKVLAEGGADVNAEFWELEYSTPLHAAVVESSFEILKYLVEQGADVNKPFQDTRMSGSVLGEAARQGKMEVVEYLVNEAKADVSMKLVYGHFGNAVAAAEHGKKYADVDEYDKYTDIIQFLEAAGGKSCGEEVAEDVAGSNGQSDG